MLPSNIRPHHLAKALGLAEPELFDAARELASWFGETFFKTTQSGKIREIDPPTKLGKYHLRRLAKFIEKECPLHSNAHGSVSRHSPNTAARRHLGHRIIVTRDVRDCFPSITSDRFFAEMRLLGFQADVSHLLCCLTLLRGRLPQGSPASNAALNLFFYRVDCQITELAGHLGGRYTRYCDDLVISVIDPSKVESTGELLENSMINLGLEHNIEKKRERGVQGLTSLRLVNGILVNSASYTRLPRNRLRQILRGCDNFTVAAESVNWRNFNRLATRRRRLQGLRQYAASVDKAPLVQIDRLLRRGDDHVVRRLQAVGIRDIAGWWTRNKVKDSGRRIAQEWRAAAENRNVVECSSAPLLNPFLTAKSLRSTYVSGTG